MKLIASLIFLFFTSTAIAATGQDFRDYVAREKPRAERSEIKWSEYYTGLYDLLLHMQSPVPSSFLSGVNDLLLHAQEYEAGKITQEQFNYYRRVFQISIAADAERQQAAQAQQAEAEAARRAAATQSALDSLRQITESRYQQVQPQPYTPGQNYTPQILPSAPPPKLIDYVCMSRCTAKSYTYQYCQSACSY